MEMMNQTTATRTLGMSTVLTVAGAAFIMLASQLSVHLPFTPVPITGQTFAVILWGLLFGSRQGASASATYLSAGLLGLPVFADFTAMTALVGPTSGYLLGFIPAAWLAGYLKETGWTGSFVGAFGSALLASMPIFVLGSIVLASFVGMGNVWMMGVVPFLIGDVIKSGIAALITNRT
ncbi:MAG: biotin transporter BioY [Ignavibacteriae bacterium]|nr:MAG: biotin transporter BioY [Ignavibacteriota bacterium]